MSFFYMSCDCDEAYKVKFSEHRIDSVEIKQENNECTAMFKIVPFPRNISTIGNIRLIESNFLREYEMIKNRIQSAKRHYYYLYPVDGFMY